MTSEYLIPHFSILNPENGFSSELYKELEEILTEDVLILFNHHISLAKKELLYPVENLEYIVKTINSIMQAQQSIPGERNVDGLIRHTLITYQFFRGSIFEKLKYRNINDFNGVKFWLIIFILKLEKLLNFCSKVGYDSHKKYDLIQEILYGIYYSSTNPLDRKVWALSLNRPINPQYKKSIRMKRKAIEKYQKLKLHTIKMYEKGVSEKEIIQRFSNIIEAQNEKSKVCSLSFENLEKTIPSWIRSYKKFKKEIIKLSTSPENSLLSYDEKAGRIHKYFRGASGKKSDFTKSLEDAEIYFKIIDIVKNYS